jgi:glycosyltransferase involved in cell wall biosynthesis
MDPREERILIVMPVHNEAAHIHLCLDSFVNQTRTPDVLRIVDDDSTDGSGEVIRDYASRYSWIQFVEHTSAPLRQPGAKVVEAFLDGLPADWEHFDFIGKFDGDIVLPANYFESILQTFSIRSNLGMCSGLLYTEQQGEWAYEPISGRSHVRGPLKCYRRSCYQAIGGLRPFIGWDTADVLLARFHGFETETRPDLVVRHLRPTGKGYSARNSGLQGVALYNLRYGWLLSGIAAAKMGLTRKSPLLPWHAMVAYCRAYMGGKPRMLTREEGRFARKWRWNGIYKRLFKGFRDR